MFAFGGFVLSEFLTASEHPERVDTFCMFAFGGLSMLSNCMLLQDGIHRTKAFTDPEKDFN